MPNNLNEYFANSNFIALAYDFFIILAIGLILLMLFFKNKGSRQKVTLFLFIALLYLIAYVIGASLSSAILGAIVINSPVILVILFIDEIKDFAKKFEMGTLKRRHEEDNSHIVRIIASACEILSKTRTGALIVIEGSEKLSSLSEKSILLNCDISEELLVTIFNTSTPLHDGAIVIRDSKVIAAGVFFQPSTDQNISKQLGSRHRAAIGASELYDSLVIIVSEESGKISVAKNGVIDRAIDKDDLIKYMEEYI